MTTSAHTVSDSVSGFNDATITDSQEQAIREAMCVLHTIVQARGASVLPSFAECGMPELNKVLSRTFSVLEEKAKARHEALLATVRSEVDGVIAAYRSNEQVLVDEFNALSPALRAKLGVICPTTVRIPFAEFEACFPEGTTHAYMIQALGTMGLSIGKAKGSDELSTKVSIAPTAPTSGVKVSNAA